MTRSWMRTRGLARSLARLLLLQGDGEHLQVPGVRPRTHLVCPERVCDGERWVAGYTGRQPVACPRRHRPRIAMVPCEDCRTTPGAHPPQ
jgi:hypothetical protein